MRRFTSGAIPLGEPRFECLRRKERKLASRVNSDKPVESTPKDRIGQCPIGQTWPDGGHFTCSVNIREHPRPERRAVGFVVVGQEFVFEFSHVHIGRALRLTSLAFKAEIESLVQITSRELVEGKFSG